MNFDCSTTKNEKRMSPLPGNFEESFQKTFYPATFYSLNFTLRYFIPQHFTLLHFTPRRFNAYKLTFYFVFYARMQDIEIVLCIFATN